MRDFITILYGFQLATKRLSEEKNITASVVLPIFQGLKTWLTHNEKAPAKSQMHIHTTEGKELRSALLKSLEFYMTKYGFFGNDLLKAITFLDARFFLFLNRISLICFVYLIYFFLETNVLKNSKDQQIGSVMPQSLLRNMR